MRLIRNILALFVGLVFAFIMFVIGYAASGNMVMAYTCGAIGLMAMFVPKPAGTFGMAMNAATITFGGGKNQGGTAGHFYYAPIEDLVSWPAALNADFDAAADFASLINVPVADPFVFKTGKCFQAIDCTLEEGQVLHKQVGTPESYAFENSYANQYPGNDADYLGFTAWGANRKFVIIAQELNGKNRVIGFPNYPARMEASEGDSGKKASDGRKNTLTFVCRGPVPPPIYNAPIPLTPAV